MMTKIEKPPRADARGASPKAKMEVDLQADILFDQSPEYRQLLCIVKQQARQIEKLEGRIEEMEDHFGRQIAELRRDMVKPAVTDSTAQDHLNRLFSEMRRLKLRQVTVRDAAKLTGVSKPHMQKLKSYVGDDMRFALVKDPHRSNRYLIRIV